MKFFSVRVVFFVLISSLTFFIPPKLLASKDKDDEREVYVASVRGDVRVSRGKEHRVDLNQPWEQALDGEPVRQSYALATGDGRAEIEFENGSTVYLAENSVLLFRELSAPGGRVVSRMSFATGTATFSLQPAKEESFYIETPTDKLHVAAPETFFARVDAYLDATTITPQGNSGEEMHRHGLAVFHIAKGQAMTMRGGDVIELAAPPLTTSAPKTRDWDAWVSDQVQQRTSAMAAALKASGLAAPIPGLVDLYEHGNFFHCEPYGTCWEATPPDLLQDRPVPSSAPGAQSPAPAQVNTSFQLQTVQWQERWVEPCGPASLRTITRIARTPQELQDLLRKKEAAEKAMLRPSPYAMACSSGYWISSKNCASFMSTQDLLNGGNGYCEHFTLLVTPQSSSKCAGAKCKPVHAPRPVWVRVGNKVGFVPLHPNDVKGKPPINLKEGIIIPPSRPGERAERVAAEPSQKVTVLDKVPHEFHSEFFNQAPRVSAPEIHAHLVQETLRQGSASLSAHAAPPITYDYNSHHFVMPASAAPGTKSGAGGVPVGGIDSHGKVGSFADGHSGGYAHAFAHSEAATTYGGGAFGTGGYGGRGSGYSGGGHSSGYSSGSYSSGSHSSGSGSSGGGSSHSSGGGGWSSGSSSGSSGGSSSSSSSSSGAGSRGRP